MKTVRVHGCLPTLAVLLAVVALTAVAVSFGAVVLAVTAGAAILLTLVGWVRRLLGRPAAPRGGPGVGPFGRGGPERGEHPTVEVLPPGWIDRETTGPVIDVPATTAPRPGGGEGDTGPGGGRP